MKILFIHNTQITSNKANVIQVLSMCNAFQFQNYEVELVLPEPSKVILNIPQFIKEKFGVDVCFKIFFYKSISSNRIIEKYLGVKSIFNLLKKSNYDYVFTRVPKFIIPILKAKKKLIFEAHNNIFHNKYKLIDLYWKAKLIKNIHHENFKLFISISENLSLFWENYGVPKNKSLSLHDGFSKNYFDNIKSKDSSRKKIGININEKIAMYIGSLYPDREIELILETSKKIKNITFYIIGGPDYYYDYYFRIVKNQNLENVRILKSIPHNMVPLYLSSADFLLGLWSRKVPTINYCSPLKIFEYMASGIPIIAHGFITIKEVLTNNENALLVDPDNKKSLGIVLNNALNMDLTKIASKSKQLVYKKYTWEKRAERIINKLIVSECS